MYESSKEHEQVEDHDAMATTTALGEVAEEGEDSWREEKAVGAQRAPHLQRALA